METLKNVFLFLDSIPGFWFVIAGGIFIAILIDAHKLNKRIHRSNKLDDNERCHRDLDLLSDGCMYSSGLLPAGSCAQAVAISKEQEEWDD